MHVVQLAITNNTPGILTYGESKFDSGRLAEGSSFPATIQPGQIGTAQCCASDTALAAGCSGWVQYTYNGTPVYFSFSDSSPDSSGINSGSTDANWKQMNGQDFSRTRSVLTSDTTWLNATMLSTEGDGNKALWNVELLDLGPSELANLELRNVEAVWAAFPADGSRTYYRCPEGVPPLSLPASHFKGIASYGNKLIFTHTNINKVVSQHAGRYLIADKVSAGRDQSNVRAIYPTRHAGAGWPHPCSSQACGSFMAMGIQQDESGPGAGASQIQILDIRPTATNQEPLLISTIERPSQGVNGVGMTKESGPNGRYVVAGINGQKLTLYRSTTSNLFAPTTTFTQVGPVMEIADSGPGLGLVTQQEDGHIYLFALNADNSGENNVLNLYKLHNWPNDNVTCIQVGGQKRMNIPGMSDSVHYLHESIRRATTIINPEITAAYVALNAMLLFKGDGLFNSSFRWGKGLTITSHTTMEVYASDRDALPLSLEGLTLLTPKDFGLVTWRSLPGGKAFLPMNMPMNVGDVLQASNGLYYAILQGDGNLCVYAGTPQIQGPFQWGSMKTGSGGHFFAIVQSDGNLCIYSGRLGKPGGYLWGSQSSASGGHFYLIMQGDGNLCMYKGTSPSDSHGFVWGSKS